MVFRPLGRSDLERIVDLQMGRVAKLAAGQGITLDVRPGARRTIASEGYDPAFGARPLRRAVQRLVQDPLAAALLEGTVSPESTVVVDAARDGAGLTLKQA